ncbi:MAG: response regulator, partial [Proteobacteria bacterium]|nr:response regulator [Pseudomonadota bacterium]
MIKKMLFVDDDRILCRLIQKKFEQYSNTFSVLTAQDGLDAVQKLKEHTISLVVTDLQMPEMDGFSLLAHLSEKYPDIPVIVQTGHSTPKSKKLVLERGAAGYIEKPFKIEQLAEKIIATLKKESEGGILQTIPLEMFIQLIEMEQKTCTIRVVDKSSGQLGVLFFQNGDLMDARIGGRHGKPAAYEIFAWDQVTLSIQDDCAVKVKKIDEDLQAILFEAMRLKDESGEDEASFEEEPYVENTEPELQKPDVGTASFEDILRQKLDNIIGDKKYLKDIYPDDSWKELLAQALEIGRLFSAGKLKTCYIDRGESTDFILLPGEKITVISLDPK